MSKIINVTKADGTIQEFSEEKLRNALMRAGVPEYLQHETLQNLKPRLYEGIPTHVIYEDVWNYLKSVSKPLAAKFSLKKSIMDLGPSGFPFEKFVGHIFEALGYKTQVGIIVQGNCVTHEIDVIAENGQEKLMCECKFHNQQGIQSDIKVSLYIYARFLDVKDTLKFTRPVLVTNTRLTSDALSYAECKNMDIISWDYPEGGSLRALIEKTKLHPITECINLKEKDKISLLDSGVVLCTDLIAMDPGKLSKIVNLPPKKVIQSQEEARAILEGHVHS